MLARDEWEVPAQQRVRLSMDWSAREMKRMTQMFRADEPLQEELQGLAWLGAFTGVLFGRPLLGNAALGMVLGAQLGPALGFVEGSRGDHVRATGWRVYRMLESMVAEARVTFDSIETWAYRSGLAKSLRRSYKYLVAVLSAFVAWTGAKAKWLRARELASALCARMHALWWRSGIPEASYRLWSR